MTMFDRRVCCDETSGAAHVYSDCRVPTSRRLGGVFILWTLLIATAIIVSWMFAHVFGRMGVLSGTVRATATVSPQPDESVQE